MAFAKWHVAGGNYQEGNEKVFSLVSPSGEESLPYVRRGYKEVTSFQNVTRHHSHLYRVANPQTPNIKLTLVHHSWEASGKSEEDPSGVDSPDSITLSVAESDRIRLAIANEERESVEPDSED